MAATKPKRKKMGRPAGRTFKQSFRLSITEDEHAMLIALALRDQRSMAGEIRWLIRETYETRKRKGVV